MTLRTSLTLFLLLGSWPATVEAYCRTYTCLPDKTCEEVEGCEVGGKPARRANGCVTFAVQRDGSALRGVSARDVRKVAEEAFALWTESECHRGGSPPFTFISLGEVACRQPEYTCDPNGWNTNVIMFQDDAWHHDLNALAITAVTMNLDTGEILDADIEINSHLYDFSLPGEPGGADLRTVIMHEAGHVLGLDHPNIPGTVMHAFYDRNALYGSLSDDDLVGICDVYGASDTDPKCKPARLPDDTECVGEPCVVVPGDGDGCSCREGTATRGGGTAPTFVALFALAGVAALRRFSLSARNI